MKPAVQSSGSGALWAIFFIALIGGTSAYVFSLDRINPNSQQNMALCLLATAIGIGIAIISATAGWWMRR